MKIRSLSLSTFRNIKQATLSFSPDVTFLLGDNAHGKTNVLEAIYLFARGKSFRGARDAEMVSFGEEGYDLSLTYEKEDRTETLSLAVRGRSKTRKRGGILLDKQSELIGAFRAVLFCPDHLQMVKGSPSERRRFMDIAISQCYPVYIAHYSRYAKNLEERNALLKAMQKGIPYTEEMLSVYSEALAEEAAHIYLYRKEYIRLLQKEAATVMREISNGKEELLLSYDGDFEGEELSDRAQLKQAYLDLFTKNTAKERAAGITLYGIHRDELHITLSGLLAKDYASQGQQRSIVLALKMAEGMVCRTLTGEAPVYLFDDVLSELDEGRRRFLLSGMKDCQFIVTGCDEKVLSEIRGNVKIIKVRDGSFLEEGSQ